MKEEVIRFLRNVGFDYNDKDEDYNFWAECEGQGDEEDSCANHQDCGICRFEYMKRHGWLSQQLSLEV